MLIDDTYPLSNLASAIEDRLDQFKKRIEPYWTIVCRHDPLLQGDCSIDSIDFEDGTVILMTQYCEPGYNQWYDHEIHIDFLDLDLTLEEFEDKIVQDHQRREEANEAREREKQRQAAKIADEQDRRTYERLRKRFEVSD